MNVGVSRVIGDVIAFQTRPGGAGDNFTRLRLNIAKANLLVLFVQRQMGMFASGDLAQRPGEGGDVVGVDVVATGQGGERPAGPEQLQRGPR